MKRIVVTGLLILGGVLIAHRSAMAAPRLVVQITVDQLRADLPRRVYPHWSERGFRYFYEQGVVYDDAHHAHINTETVVGHATLATGAHPARHGMIANQWFSRAGNRVVYNVEDADYPVLPVGVDSAADVRSGRSPRAIRGTTIADEIALAGAGRAQVFAVSVKDRGAIPMAGRAGQAYWYDKDSGFFVTSRYYRDTYPAWVQSWNDAGHARRLSGQHWQLLLPRAAYAYGNGETPPWTPDVPVLGRAFPHSLGDAASAGFAARLSYTPFADELTAAFARELIVSEAMGQDDVTDYLSISFSSTDYIGHVFGPSSLEAEDNLLRLDRTLNQLIDFIDSQVGLANTLLVLSADHGVADVVAHMQQQRLDAGHLVMDGWPGDALDARLQEAFGEGNGLIQSVVDPFVYLDLQRIDALGLDVRRVASVVAHDLATLKGMGAAYVVSDLLDNRLTDSTEVRLSRNNIDSERSGEVVFFPAQNWFPMSAAAPVNATHGSPWEYDTHVPVVFAGYGLSARRVVTRAETVSVAPTIAAVLGIKAPSGSDGRVLPDVVQR